MPELPEVETTVRGLNKEVLNRAFINVWSDWEKLIKKPKNFEEFKKIIIGRKIKRIWRRAKNIIFDLSDGCSLLIHQKMTGHLLFGTWNLKHEIWVPDKPGPLNDPYNRFLHLIFFFDNKKMMALSDARKFAKVELWKTEELKKELEKNGPEPLDKNFTFEKFKKIFKNPAGKPLASNGASKKGKRGKIKQILMDQSVIAGVGNIYASEALWEAKIHPEKNVAKLSEKELKSLYQAIRKVLSLGVKLGGESFSDYRKPDGSKGNFDTERKAYKREGQFCKRCKAKIKRIKFGGRSAFYCENCQKF